MPTGDMIVVGVIIGAMTLFAVTLFAVAWSTNAHLKNRQDSAANTAASTPQKKQVRV